MKAPDTNSLKYYHGRFEALKKERTTFDEHWKELSRYLAPRRGRFITSDRNKGERAWKEQIESLIEAKRGEIATILGEFGVPVVDESFAAPGVRR